MTNCGYPTWTWKNKKKSTPTTKTNRKANDQPNKSSVVIPYVKGLSEAVSRVMKKHGVSTAMRPANKLRNILVHPKDKVEELDKGQGVYKVPCLSCPAVYIGETISRRLGTRIDEHKKDCDKIKPQKFTRSQKQESKQTYNKPGVPSAYDRMTLMIVPIRVCFRGFPSIIRGHSTDSFVREFRN